MSYLSFIIALILFVNRNVGEGMTFYQGLDVYLDMVVALEFFFLRLSVVFFFISLAIFLLMLLTKDEIGITCSCGLLFLGIGIPIMEAITYWIATGLADSIGPAGMTNSTQFWLLAILMFLLGAG